MKKVIRDGKVAVLISPGYGAGWYTWHGIEELLYDPQIVRILENPDADEDSSSIERYCEKTYGDDSYYGGAEGLKVVWLPEGTKFVLDEYDGSETLRILEKMPWLTA